MSWLVDPTQHLLERALDGLSRRQQLIAANLANIDTPGYRPMSVDFESALRAELAGAGMPGGSLPPGGAGTAATTGAAALLPPSIGPSAAVALRTTDPRHVAAETAASGAVPAGRAFDGSLRNDGNTVDLESEVTALAETQLRFGAVSRLVSGKLGMLRDVAGGR